MLTTGRRIAVGIGCLLATAFAGCERGWNGKQPDTSVLEKLRRVSSILHAYRLLDDEYPAAEQLQRTPFMQAASAFWESKGLAVVYVRRSADDYYLIVSPRNMGRSNNPYVFDDAKGRVAHVFMLTPKCVYRAHVRDRRSLPVTTPEAIPWEEFLPLAYDSKPQIRP